MPITAEQLNAIKAANHAKTKAWEAATFLTDEIVNFQYKSYPDVIRTECGTWRCSATGTIYETLSRWAREKWGGSLNFKCSLSLYSTDGKRLIHTVFMPPVAERSLYYPWNPAGKTWTPAPAPAPATASSPAPATAPTTAPAPAPVPAEPQPIKTLRTYTFDQIKTEVNAVIDWIDKKDQTITRKFAGINELIDWLIDHKKAIIEHMLDRPTWRITLNAIILAYGNDFVDNEKYGEFINKKVDEYFEHFQNI